MATIRGAFGGGQIKGSLSGVVFQGSKAGTIMRNRSIPVNPSSPFQLLVRSALALASNGWNLTLSEEERQAWNAYAAATPLLDRFGEEQHTSGRQMFIRTNAFAFYVGAPLYTAAPNSPGLIAPGNIAVTASEADGIEVAAPIPAIGADETIFFQIGTQRNPAVNYYNAPFSAIALYNDASTFPDTITPPLPLHEGNVMWFRWRRISADGKVSYANQIRVTVEA